MTKILLFGSKGQLGKEIKKNISNDYKVYALHKHSRKYCGNFLENKKVIQSIRDIQPDIIINASAYTSVDDAEANRKAVKKINIITPQKIAYEASKINALLIHFSSDYVFSGRGKKPWNENSPTTPKNYYGFSKAECDRMITSSGCKYTIIRSSWIYGVKGKNFFNTIIELSIKKTELNVINDQIGAPTSTIFIAKAVEEIINDYLLNKNKSKFLNQIFNIVPEGFASWYEFAFQILANLEKMRFKKKLCKDKIIKVLSKDFPQKALRPLNSRLNINKAKKTFDLKFLTWQEDLENIIYLKLNNK